MKKLYNYEGEIFRLDENALEDIKQNYGTKEIYLVQDQGTRYWSITDKRTPFNTSYTWKVYLPNPSKKHPEQPNYEDIAYSLGYLYDEDEVMNMLARRGKSLRDAKL